MEIHERIRSYREDKRLSQYDMAALMDISQSAYLQIEKGKTDLTIKRAIQIAHVLEVPLHELLEIVPDLEAFKLLQSENADLKSENSILKKELADVKESNKVLEGWLKDATPLLKIMAKFFPDPDNPKPTLPDPDRSTTML